MWRLERSHNCITFQNAREIRLGPRVTFLESMPATEPLVERCGFLSKPQLQNRLHCLRNRDWPLSISHMRLANLMADPLGLHQGVYHWKCCFKRDGGVELRPDLRWNKSGLRQRAHNSQPPKTRLLSS